MLVDADVVERVAREFHATYERLASTVGYETRRASAVPWPQVPEPNRRLMVAVVEDLFGRGMIAAPPDTQRTPTSVCCCGQSCGASSPW